KPDFPAAIFPVKLRSMGKTISTIQSITARETNEQRLPCKASRSHIRNDVTCSTRCEAAFNTCRLCEGLRRRRRRRPEAALRRLSPEQPPQQQDQIDDDTGIGEADRPLQDLDRRDMPDVVEVEHPDDRQDR